MNIILTWQSYVNARAALRLAISSLPIDDSTRKQFETAYEELRNAMEQQIAFDADACPTRATK